MWWEVIEQKVSHFIMNYMQSHRKFLFNAFSPPLNHQFPLSFPTHILFDMTSMLVVTTTYEYDVCLLMKCLRFINYLRGEWVSGWVRLKVMFLIKHSCNENDSTHSTAQRLYVTWSLCVINHLHMCPSYCFKTSFIHICGTILHWDFLVNIWNSPEFFQLIICSNLCGS